MTKITVFTSSGNKKDSMDLPKDFTAGKNVRLVAQAVRVYEDRSHEGNSKVKTRGEVKISTRKIYRQKGTGYARHGAKSAPIFVGGGIAHGPHGNKRVLHLNKKMARTALLSSLNLLADKNMLFAVEGMSEIKKTRQAYELLKKIGIRSDINSVAVGLSDRNKNVKLAFRNLPGVKAVDFKNLNITDITNSMAVVVDSEVFKPSTKTSKTEEPKKTAKPSDKTKVNEGRKTVAKTALKKTSQKARVKKGK